MKARCVSPLFAALLQLLSFMASADQGGTPFWTSGQFASLSAVPPSPGWSTSLAAYSYKGRATGSSQLPIGGEVVAQVTQQSPSLSAQLGYAPQSTLFGGQPFVGLSWGVGGNRVRGEVTLPSGVQVTRSDSLYAGSDLYPFGSLSWARGNDNWMTYLTADIPTGAYEASRLANIGIGHTAADGGVGYTYYDSHGAMEYSVIVGLSYNWKDTHTAYKDGIESHLDWAASRFVTGNWELGVVGYVYYELSGDSGNGASLGPFKSRVAAIGPEVGYQFTVGGQQWSANLRAYWEFWAHNRYEGRAVFAALNIPLAGP